MPRPITRTGASGSHDDDECPNPPPMPSTMADAIAALVNATAENARLLRELAQNQQAPYPNHGRRNNGNDESTYVDFTDTRPPVFSKAEEPLEADDWLRTIEQKFKLIHCTKVCGTTTSRSCWCLVGEFGSSTARWSPNQLEGVQGCLQGTLYSRWCDDHEVRRVPGS